MSTLGNNELVMAAKSGYTNIVQHLHEVRKRSFMKNDVEKQEGRLNSGDSIRSIRDVLDGRDLVADIVEMAQESELDMSSARAPKGNAAGVPVKLDRNRAKGMMWGLIVGDAFGSPVQFCEKDDHPWITEMVACPTFGLPPGCWTDDGSMAMCIMDSYVRMGGYDLKDIGMTFVKWLDDGYLSSMEGRSFDVGGATMTSVSEIAYMGRLSNGYEESQGNGSIMRFAPSYLLSLKEQNPIKVMHEINDLTHYSRRVHEVIDRMAGILDDHMAGRRTSEVSPYKTREEVDNSGWAVSTLDAALWAFNTTESFEEGLIAAVNLGGDADTIGAVFGQIAGAYYGYDAIPERWVKAVKTWENVDSLIERFLDAALGRKQ